MFIAAATAAASSSFSPWLLLIPLAIVGLVLANRGERDKKPSPPPAENLTWWYGPIPPGYPNYSINMPKGPTPVGSGWRADIGPNQELDAVIRRFSLKGKTQVRARIRVEGDTIRGSSDGKAARLTFMFQRKGDNWSAANEYNYYRWYARHRMPLTPGEHEVTIPLTRANFGYVQKPKPNEVQYSEAQIDAFFQAALNETDNIAFGCGSDSASHGVVSVKPASITLLALDIT